MSERAFVCDFCGSEENHGVCNECYVEAGTDLAAAREGAERWRALEALDRGLGGWHLTVHEGHPPENCVIHYSRTGTYYTGATLTEAFDAMLAALGLEVET